MNKPVDDKDRLEQELEQMFNEISAPSARRDRALFVAGVAARKPKPIWQRALVPAMGVAIVFISLSVASLKAAPGQALWSVRNVLNSVGLAQPVEIVNKGIRAAEADVERAEDALDDDDLDQAQRFVDRALERVGEASIHLEDLSGEAREEAVEDIEDVREDVSDTREDIAKARLELFEERAEERAGDDDSSGPGSGSDDDSDDSSGPGSDDDSDDSSGSGSGDSDSDDSSGSGSGGSGSDDSSGSGSGGSGSDDSSGRGSGSDDSSGKGSG
ncbi:MAG: hypothetical protein ACRDKZ_03510, partial [Actinomycetota bacterium]